MSTHIWSDQITRQVMARIDTDERAAAHRRGRDQTVWVHYFAPTEASATFTNGVLVKVVLRGPRVTKAGDMHSTQWASWIWPRDERRGADVESIWDASPPQCLQDFLTELGVPR